MPRRPDTSSDDDNDNTERSSLSAPARPSDDINENNQAISGTLINKGNLLSDSPAKQQQAKKWTSAKQEDDDHSERGYNMENSFASLAAMSTAPAPIVGTAFIAKGNRQNDAGVDNNRFAPGAVAMKGDDGCVIIDGNEVADDNEDEYSPTIIATSKNAGDPTNNLESTTTIVAEAVVREDDVEAQVEHRFRERADELAENILARLRQTVVVDAEKVENTTDENVDGLLDDDATRAQLTKRKRLFRIAGSVAALIVLIIVIVVVVVVLVTRKPSSPSPTVPPTSAPAVLLSSPPSTFIPATVSPSVMVPNVPELQSNTSATLLQLVDGASNHTLLAQYLNYSYNVLLLDILSTQQVTLFAPSDASFLMLQYPPYQFYFSEDNFYWRPQLYFLLNTHIVTENITSSFIFLTTSLPTLIDSTTLNVNNINRTIENDAALVQADIQGSNGYIQVPDRVILIPQLRETLRDHVMKTSGYVFSDKITKFRALLIQSGLENELSRMDVPFGFTLFLPFDSAFDLLDENVTEALFSTSNSNFTRDIILYHMIALNLIAVEAPAERVRFMKNKIQAWYTTNNPQNSTFVNTAKVLDSYSVQNGVIQVIDQVLVPPTIGDLLHISSSYTLDFNFTTFLNIVNGPAELSDLFKAKVEGYTNLGRVNDPLYLTVFAPLDQAFSKASNSQLSLRLNHWLQPNWLLHLQNFVRHHFTLSVFPDDIGQYVLSMLSGFDVILQYFTVGNDFVVGNLTIDGVQVDEIPGSLHSDIFAANGLMYVIDDVLLPPWADRSIYQTLIADTNLSTFASLVNTSAFFTSLLNRTDDIGSSGPWTILAPSNEAFAELTNNNNRSSITNSINHTIEYSNATFVHELLSHHILSGNVYSPITSLNVSTINNQTLLVIVMTNADVVENNATITSVGGALLLSANTLASNGVIHVIDRVLLAL